MARARDDMAEHFEEVLADDGWEEWQGFRSHMPVDDKPYLVNMLPANPSVAGIVEQLLGKGSVAPIGDKIRGVNCNLPLGHGAPSPDGPDAGGVRIDALHVDAHPFNLGTTAYFDTVEPGGGGFTIAPRSHRRLWHTFELQYDTLRRQDSVYGMEAQHHSHGYHQAMQSMHRELDGGVEFVGEAGDVLFWHHRLAHGAGTNNSKKIRAACLHDFHRTDLQRHRERAPPEDMWLDWGPELRACPEPAEALPPPPPAADVDIRFLRSEPGPMPQPEPAWLCWNHKPLGEARFSTVRPHRSRCRGSLASFDNLAAVAGGCDGAGVRGGPPAAGGEGARGARVGAALRVPGAAAAGQRGDDA